METAQQLIAYCVEKIKSINSMTDFSKYKARIDEIDLQISNNNIWSDAKKAGALMKERQRLTDFVTKIQSLSDDIDFYSEIAKELPEELPEQQEHIAKIYDELLALEFHRMMTDPMANSPAILTINAGAGGLEAANFVTMMSRMYLRWADAYNFKVEILDNKPSEEHSSICTDSVSYRIDGPYAYGFLKGENGVHRLIRNSPFNAGDARHTSFAAVSVTPDIEDTIDIKIEDKDIEITAQTSSGSGGQNVNKVASAIRLKHLPTGINILVRTERDQLSNKKTALKMLKSKLYDIEKKKRQSEKDKFIESQMDAKFGSQIRTYTLSPYSLVKDHRTDFEHNNCNRVLDGDIQEFIFAYLRYSAKS